MNYLYKNQGQGQSDSRPEVSWSKARTQPQIKYIYGNQVQAMEFLINDPSPDALDSLGSYIPSPGHTGWDLEGAHKRVWAVGLGIFDPCKKGSLVQALVLGK